MESTSKTSEKWKLCSYASFVISCFILLLCLSFNTEVLGFWSLKNSMITTMPPLYSLPAQENARFLNVAGNGYGNANAFPQNHEKCDIFEGKWVYKPMESPLYEVSKCPFLSDQVSCQRNGRPDSDYEKWSWEASGCVVPSFNATDMLERLRGKRVIIVGDSLNRNQWESLACLLYSAIPSSRAIVSVQSGSYKVFKAKDYNVSVEFYWSPFLVQLDSNQAGSPKVLRLDKLDPSSKRWKGAEIMVFNTGHWWTHRGKLKAWDLFQYEEKLTDEMGIESAFKLAMQTWGKWIDDNIDPTKTTIFFRSISPEHHGQHWCYNETKPIIDMSDMTVFPEPLRKIVERTVSNLKTRVRYLNITKLSQYRKDAHPTVYARKNGKQMIEKKLNPKETYSDCSHWCLPGLPDTWNRLLYASMVLDGSTCGPNSKHFISHSTSSIVNSSNA